MEVTLSSGVKFNHRETLKIINAHKRGKFYNTDVSSTDLFWPLGQHRAVHFAKKLGIESRIFEVEGYGDYNAYQAWACNIRFHRWADETGFALDLADFREGLADFGSVALKLTELADGSYDLNECDLLKLWFDPTIKSFYNNTKIELHELEEHEVFEKIGWEDKRALAWEKALRVDNIETQKSDTVNTAIVKKKFWERVGWFNVNCYKGGNLQTGEYIQEYRFDDKGNILKDANGNPVKNPDLPASEWKFMHTIHAGVGDGEVVVFAGEIKPEEDIYLDLHISKYEDRWLRVGVYERLFDLQQMTNESVNYDRINQQIASLLLFASGEEKIIGSKILREAESGTVLGDKDLKQIGISNTYANEFIATLRQYEAKADLLCLTPDIMTGTEADTVRGGIMATNAASSAFRMAMIRIGTVIASVLTKRVLPEEVENWNAEKSLEISGFDADMRMYDALARVVKENEWISEEFAKGRNPSEEEKIAFREDLQRDIELNGRKLVLPEKFYDFEFGLRINPVGESENKDQQLAALLNVTTMALNNPAVVTIPSFREYSEKSGVTPFHLTMEQQQMIRENTIKPTELPAKQDKLLSAVNSE